MSAATYDIFISYKREREPLVEWLKEVLEEAYGFSVWWDGALRPGIPFEQQLRERMHQARVILVFLCDEAVKETSWVKNEIEVGLDQRKLFTVSYGPDSDFPDYLRKLHLMSVSDWNGDPRHIIARRLSRKLKERIGTQFASRLLNLRAKHEEWCDVDCPWKKNENTSIPAAELIATDTVASTPQRAVASEIPSDQRHETIQQPYPTGGQPYPAPSHIPSMVTIPAGAVMCGARKGEPGAGPNEFPEHMVRIARPFALSQSPVTVAQWEAFRKDCDPSCKPSADPPSYPKVNVTWYEARAYATWLSEKSSHGCTYRLPSEAEWEYAARLDPRARDSTGDRRLFGWGDGIEPRRANYDATRSFMGSAKIAGKKALVEVGRYPENKLGLYDMHGNVAEWVADSYHRYSSDPSDGKAIEKNDGQQIMGIVRGGSYLCSPEDLRCAARREFRKNRRAAHIGFRVAHDGPAQEEEQD